MEALVFVLFVLALVAFALWAWMQARRRREELAQWAAANGLSFSPGSDYALNDRYPNLSCLHQGSDRYAYNVMEGERSGRRVCAFDFHYETHSTDSKGRRETHHHHFSVVVIHTGLPLKPLFIRAEGFFDKVTEFFGYDDIDFESAEFSRKFYVKAADRQWAFDVLQPATMEFLLESPRFTVETDEGRIAAYRSSTFAVADFAAALGVIDGIIERLPDYLHREWKGAT